MCTKFLQKVTFREVSETNLFGSKNGSGKMLAELTYKKRNPSFDDDPLFCIHFLRVTKSKTYVWKYTNEQSRNNAIAQRNVFVQSLEEQRWCCRCKGDVSCCTKTKLIRNKD